MSNNKIMIVEDDKDLREIYEIILTHAGYEVCTAVNGAEALDTLQACEPRLVLLDIFMPVMDGKIFLQKSNLKSNEEIKVIVCSNTSDETLMNDMLKLGAQTVVNKSKMDPKDLVELVKVYI